jgi:hypothetical protein
MLQDILGNAELFARGRALLLQVMIFAFACLVVVAIVIIWRAEDIGRILEAVVSASRSRGS